MSKFNISDDGFIFSIGSDGTINRIGKIDSYGNVEGQSRRSNSSVGVLSFFLAVAAIVAIVLGINLSDASHKLSYYRSEYYSLEGNNSRLKSENGNLNREISNLKKQLPTWYTVTSDAHYYYKARCGYDGYAYANCYIPSGRSEKIYKVDGAYGLSETGWLPMSQLRRQ